MKIIFGVLVGLGIYHVGFAGEVAEAVAAPPRTPEPQYDVLHCTLNCTALDGLRGEARDVQRYNDGNLTFAARGRHYILQPACGCYVEGALR